MTWLNGPMTQSPRSTRSSRLPPLRLLCQSGWQIRLTPAPFSAVMPPQRYTAVSPTAVLPSSIPVSYVGITPPEVRIGIETVTVPTVLVIARVTRPDEVAVSVMVGVHASVAHPVVVMMVARPDEIAVAIMVGIHAPVT